MLDDTVFHFVQTEMVGVEDALGALQVEVVLGVFLPRQVDEILQVIELYAIFRSLRVGAFQFLQLALKDVRHFLRPFLLLGFLCQLLDILLVGIAAQLFLDGAQLLVQVVFALLLVHVDTDLALYLLLQLHHLLLVGQHRQEVGGHLVEGAGFEE